MVTTTETRPVRIGINGFGRMGRLAVRGLARYPDLELIHVNDPNSTPATSAHLLEFDTVHGRYQAEITSDGDTITVDRVEATHSEFSNPSEVPWADPLPRPRCGQGGGGRPGQWCAEHRHGLQ